MNASGKNTYQIKNHVSDTNLLFSDIINNLTIYMKIIISFVVILFTFATCFSQPCIQPGSLVSVRNISTEKYEYLVFKFLKPLSDKGVLSAGTDELFPFNKGKKYSYHKIVFNNVPHLCYNKLNINFKNRKLLDLKIQQKTDNMVSYVFVLAEGAKIKGHYVKQQQDLYYVKIRIE